MARKYRLQILTVLCLVPAGLFLPSDAAAQRRVVTRIWKYIYAVVVGSALLLLPAILLTLLLLRPVLLGQPVWILGSTTIYGYTLDTI